VEVNFVNFVQKLVRRAHVMVCRILCAYYVHF